MEITLDIEYVFVTQQPFREGLLERTGLFSPLTEISKNFYKFRLQAKSLYFEDSGPIRQFHRNKRPTPSQQYLAKLPWMLRRLSLFFNPDLSIGDYVVRRFCKLRHLKILTADPGPAILTGQALEYLPGLHSLEWDFTNCDLRQVSLVHFTAMQKLVLKCWRRAQEPLLPLQLPSSTRLESIHYDGLTTIPHQFPTQLTELVMRYIDWDQFPDGERILYPDIQALTRLRSLYLNDHCPPHAEHFLPTILQLTNLEYLNCSVCELSNDSLCNLLPLRQLKHLNFNVGNNRCDVTDDSEPIDANCFRNQTNLKKLWVCGAFDPDSVHALGRLHQLEDLRSTCPVLGNSMADICVDFPQLKMLFLERAPQFSDADLTVLCAACPLITYLMIKCAPLTDAAVGTLSQYLPDLRSLDLGLTLVGPDSKHDFSKLTSLMFVGLNRTHATDDTVGDLTHLHRHASGKMYWLSEDWDPMVGTHGESLAPDVPDYYWWTIMR